MLAPSIQDCWKCIGITSCHSTLPSIPSFIPTEMSTPPVSPASLSSSNTSTPSIFDLETEM